MFKKLILILLPFVLLGNTAIKNDKESVQERDKFADVGAGYNKLSNTYLPSCFQNVESVSPNEAQESILSFKNDLKEEFFRNVFNLELEMTVPIQELINLNPKFIFKRDASVTNLSHTSTYFAHTTLGENKIAPYSNRIELKPQFRRYFDADGNLINPYEFVRLCGDEMIRAQTLSSKLLITTKISFKSKKDKLYFEGELGVSPSIMPGFSINAKIKNLDLEVRQRLRMNFYAIQIGGQPERLITALPSNSCVLSDLAKCDEIVRRLHDYAANDYSTQLIPALLGRWNIENLQSIPYHLLDLYDTEGKLLRFDAISTPEILDKLNKLKIAAQKRAVREQSNYQIALMMKETKYLGTDEIATLDSILRFSEENIQKINEFGNQCYLDLIQCISIDPQELFSKILILYDDTLLHMNIGKLISKVYASTRPPNPLDGRVSQDFVILQPELSEGAYSSYYIKYKDINNYVINTDLVTTDIKCNKHFFMPKTLIKDAFQYYEVLAPQMEINYKDKCNDEKALYVANPNGFAELLGKDNLFVVELWGRP